VPRKELVSNRLDAVAGNSNSMLIMNSCFKVYYVHKVVVDYLKNSEDVKAAKQIFGILNHPTFLFHLKREFGFREFLLFLLNWLPRA
jgi:hypothetical protein